MAKSMYSKKEQNLIDAGGDIAEALTVLISAVVAQHPEKARKAGKRLTERMIDFEKAAQEVVKDGE